MIWFIFIKRKKALTYLIYKEIIFILFIFEWEKILIVLFFFKYFGPIYYKKVIFKFVFKNIFFTILFMKRLFNFNFVNEKITYDFYLQENGSNLFLSKKKWLNAILLLENYMILVIFSRKWFLFIFITKIILQLLKKILHINLIFC